MPKKIKLELSNLTIESFKTELKGGGVSLSELKMCEDTDFDWCRTHPGATDRCNGKTNGCY